MFEIFDLICQTNFTLGASKALFEAISLVVKPLITIFLLQVNCMQKIILLTAFLLITSSLQAQWSAVSAGGNDTVGGYILSSSVGELLVVFLWKSGEEAGLGRVKVELADVLAYALLLADRCKLDVRQIILDKIAPNALKYPVDKAAGNVRKYTDL